MAHVRKFEKDIRCPLEYGFDMLGGRWKSRAICILAAQQPLRYGELRDEMVNISDTMLASTIKSLEQDGLILRTQFNEMPPRVEYSLTPKGESVVPILQAICRWAGQFNRTISDDAPSHCKDCDFHADETGLNPF